jgi:hypothetical protein
MYTALYEVYAEVHCLHAAYTTETDARLACLLNYSYDIQTGKRRNHSSSLSLTISPIGHILTSHWKAGQPLCKDSLFTAELPESAVADQVGISSL